VCQQEEETLQRYAWFFLLQMSSIRNDWGARDSGVAQLFKMLKCYLVCKGTWFLQATLWVFEAFGSQARKLGAELVSFKVFVWSFHECFSGGIHLTNLL